MKTFLWLLIVIFCVTLAVVIGNRMSAEAMAVVIGVVCGVVASIPMGVIMLIATGRRERPPEPVARTQVYAPPASPYPPVVVIGAGGQPAYALHQPSLPPVGYAMPQAPRQFHIIGEEAE